jgi:threonine aldolase
LQLWRLLASRLSISKVDVEKREPRHDLASDNTLGICPEAFAALEDANIGSAASYGDDAWTARLCERVREIFETDCEVFLVFNGTVANALALAQLCQPFHSIICHKNAHIHTDECGAPEFFTSGSKLLTIGGANGKIDMQEAAEVIARQPELHAHRPRVVSLAQTTELGTVYSPNELAEIGNWARKRDMLFHMDGARFANAVAGLNCAPKEITWMANVDVLCFGGTKNGLAAGELVIFFNKELAREFDYRLKQAGQLASKMRFLAAPWLGILNNDVWLRNARHANEMARLLAEGLRSKAKIDIVFPAEANAVFVRLSDHVARYFQSRGWQFYKFIEPDVYRFMCSWATTEADLVALIFDAGCIQE